MPPVSFFDRCWYSMGLIRQPALPITDFSLLPSKAELHRAPKKDVAGHPQWMRAPSQRLRPSDEILIEESRTVAEIQW